MPRPNRHHGWAEAGSRAVNAAPLDPMSMPSDRNMRHRRGLRAANGASHAVFAAMDATP